MAERRRFYKAATTKLTGPHYGGLTYLPGSHHALGLDDPFDSDPNGWCTAGLYVTSHIRVAGRWGPVVLEVLKDAGAPLVKTTQRHKPTGVPAGVDSGVYAKYRTTGFQVIRIVGITAYGFDQHDSWLKAKGIQRELNLTLARHGLYAVEMDRSEPLEVLRDGRYNVWSVYDPNTVVGRSARPPRVRHRVRHRVEIEFEAGRQLTEKEIVENIDQLPYLFPETMRIVSMR